MVASITAAKAARIAVVYPSIIKVASFPTSAVRRARRSVKVLELIKVVGKAVSKG
jgi:hypothetical protein